jgi:DNA-binding transcriptional ArsR family regulator
MRTSGLALALLAAFVVATPIAAAETTSLERLLQELGVLPPSAPQQPQVPDPKVDPADPTASIHKALGFAEVVKAMVKPAAILGAVVGFLGLSLSEGLFGGFHEGGNIIASAMNAVGTSPGKSFFIATMSIALAGATAAVGHWVQRYGSFGAIPLYTRITKSALFENGVRQQIFDLISQDPGINVSEISRRLDIAWGTATHHLQKLRHEKLVSIRMTSNQKCYFPNGGTYTPREMDVMSAVKHPTAKQIAEFLILNGPRCHRDIALALDLTPALVSFHTSKLIQNGVVAREKQGRNTFFTALEANLQPAQRAVSH